MYIQSSLPIGALCGTFPGTPAPGNIIPVKYGFHRLVPLAVIIAVVIIMRMPAVRIMASNRRRGYEASSGTNILPASSIPPLPRSVPPVFQQYPIEVARVFPFGLWLV